MVHVFLQFTLRIAFRCVLHRCASQDIRCSELSWLVSLALSHSRLLLLVWFGVGWLEKTSPEARQEPSPKALSQPEINPTGPAVLSCESRGQQASSQVWIVIDSMILPQVHLRKPCYDFSFL